MHIAQVFSDRGCFSLHIISVKNARMAARTD